jgi:predicted nucleic acid-binding protein
VKYVIDASVVLKWFLPEEDDDKASALLEGLWLGQHLLLAPDLIVAEVGNALWKRSSLRGKLAAADASAIYRDFLTLRLTLFSSTDIGIRALEVAIAEGHSFYDCLYVALAASQNCDFLTADETLVRKLGSRFARVRNLATL